MTLEVINGPVIQAGLTKADMDDLVTEAAMKAY